MAWNEPYDDFLTRIQRESDLFHKAEEWLEGEVKSHDGTCYEEQEESFEMGVLAGRLECASGLQAQIQQWEKDQWEKE